ncbi:MAG: DMT family transporter [Geminicoccaceae bacterium]|nr:DMT family transporter [Geminicoccaceae bacterium]MCX8101921.1 DMT family transporter [Geminicoccaceae bacterium]MDW8368993.1 DMT family transporter [Geminicoccaceae bacterium]
MSTARRNLEGALVMAGAMTAFTVNDTFVKLLAERLPIGQIMTLRGLAVLPLLLLLLRAQAGRLALHACLEPWVLARAAAETVTSWLFLASIAALPLADAMVLFFSAPILLTVAAALFLREPVGWRRWSAVLVGFAGVALAAAPAGNWTPAVLLPLASATTSVLRDIVTRRIPTAVPTAAVSIATASTVALSGFASLPWGWPVPSAGEAALLVLCAVLLAAGYQGFVHAVRTAELSVVSPIRYVSVPISMITGYLFWRHLPNARMVAGAFLIVGSGLFILWRAHRLAAAERGR